MIGSVFAQIIICSPSVILAVQAEEAQYSVGFDSMMVDSLLETLSKSQIHGFLSQGFLWSSDNNYLFGQTAKGEFNYNEIGINFSSELSRKLRVGLQLFSRSLGSLANNKVQLDWAYADYRYRDKLGFRAGKLKVPFGLHNETRDVDQLRTWIILPQSVYQENYREIIVGLIGFGIYGELPIESFGSLSYVLQGGTLSADDDESGPPHLLAELGITSADLKVSSNYMLSGALFWDAPFELRGLSVGGTLIYGDRTTWTGETIIPLPIPFLGVLPAGTPFWYRITNTIGWAASLEYAVEDVTLTAEFMQIIGNLDVFILQSRRVYQEGFYIGLSYLLTDKCEIGTYYSMYWPEAMHRTGDVPQVPGDPDYASWQQEIAVAARYDLLANWCVKLEGHYVNGVGQVLNQFNPGGVHENWFLGAFKTSFTF